MSPESSFPSWSEIAPVDWVGVGLISVLVALGLVRGLWWQVIRLVGVVLAVALARVFSPEGAEWIAERWPELSPRLAHGTAWFGIFLVAIGAASLLGWIGQRILETMQLGFVNRLGGGVAGALTGGVLFLAGLVVFCQLAPATWVERYVSGTYSERLVDATGDRWGVVLGAEAADEIKRLLQPLGVESPLDVPEETPLDDASSG